MATLAVLVDASMQNHSQNAHYEALRAAVPHMPRREQPHRLLSGPLRRGKWTSEEEEYVAVIIQYFCLGVLPVQYGTTLRGYIAELVHCDPMRVSKKLVPGTVFVGIRIDPKMGRRSYYPSADDAPGVAQHKLNAEQHLAQMRALFIQSLEREEEAVMTEASMEEQLLQPSLTRLAEQQWSTSPTTASQDLPFGGQPLPSLSQLLREKRIRSPYSTSEQPRQVLPSLSSISSPPSYQ